MTKDELFFKIAVMLPIENTDSKPFRILLSDSLKTYLSYINKTEGINDEDKKEIAYICEVIKAIVKAQYKGLHAQAFRKLSNLFSGKTGHKGFGNILFVSQLGANNSLYDPFDSPCRGQKPQKEGCNRPPVLGTASL